jgi:cytochrome c553
MPANRPISFCRGRARAADAPLRHPPVAAASLIPQISGNRQVAADVATSTGKAERRSGYQGENGVSQTDKTPSLVAQPDQSSQWQLVFLRSSAHKRKITAPVAEQLSNEKIRDLTACFASLKSPDVSAAKPVDDHRDVAEVGKKAITAGRCSPCHGDNLASFKAVARISGTARILSPQSSPGSQGGPRIGGGVAAMAEVAYQLSEQDVSARLLTISRDFERYCR